MRYIIESVTQSLQIKRKAYKNFRNEIVSAFSSFFFFKTIHFFSMKNKVGEPLMTLTLKH